EQPHHRGELAPPQGRHGGEQEHPAREVEGLDVEGVAHGRSVQARKNEVVTASRARTNDPASSSGTRNRRSLAMNTSAAASPAPTTATLATRASTANGSPDRPAPAIPHGAKRLVSRPSSTVSRIDAAHSISPRSAPAYSSTMA